MPKTHIYPIDEVVAALTKAGGIRSVAARLIGCSTSTIDNYVKQFPEVAEAIAEARANLVGMAQLGLIHHVREKDLRACMFVLETLGRNEGWSRRQEITGPDGGPVQVVGAVQFTIVHPNGTRTEIAPPSGDARTRAQLAIDVADSGKPRGDAVEQDV